MFRFERYDGLCFEKERERENERERERKQRAAAVLPLLAAAHAAVEAAGLQGRASVGGREEELQGGSAEASRLFRV